jgi:cell division control protein 45
LILLNCGGTVHLEKIFTLNNNQSIIVIDSHRPFHLANIYSSKVVLFDDSDGSSVISINKLSDLEITGVEESDDEEEEDNLVFETEDDENEHYRKKEQILKTREYYRTSYTSKSCSKILSELSFSLNKNNNDHLWMGIIGLTEQFLFQKITHEEYTKAFNGFKLEVASLNRSKSSNMEVDDGMEIKISSDERIVQSEEFIFPLYRHWNIFDSMYHSSYIASRLSIWNEKGRSKLKVFLAKIGIPLTECQQNYQNMKFIYKEELDKKMKKFGKNYSLYELFFDSFYRVREKEEI